MNETLYIIAFYMLIAAVIWSVIVITLGDCESRRRRDFDILHALDDLRREIDEIRRHINRHDP